MIDLIKEQDRYQREVFHIDLTKLSKEDRAKKSNEMISALIDEACEVRREYKALPWKTDKENREKICEELIDMQHFMNNLYLIWGITSEEVLKEYYSQKLTANFERGKVH